MEIDAASLELIDLVHVRVNTGHPITHVRKPGSGWQTDIAGTDDGYSFRSTQSLISGTRSHPVIVTMKSRRGENIVPIPS